MPERAHKERAQLSSERHPWLVGSPVQRERGEVRTGYREAFESGDVRTTQVTAATRGGSSMSWTVSFMRT